MDFFQSEIDMGREEEAIVIDLSDCLGSDKEVEEVTPVDVNLTHDVTDGSKIRQTDTNKSGKKETSVIKSVSSNDRGMEGTKSGIKQDKPFQFQSTNVSASDDTTSKPQSPMGLSDSLKDKQCVGKERKFMEGKDKHLNPSGRQTTNMISDELIAQIDQEIENSLRKTLNLIDFNKYDGLKPTTSTTEKKIKPNILRKTGKGNKRFVDILDDFKSMSDSELSVSSSRKKRKLSDYPPLLLDSNAVTNKPTLKPDEVQTPTQSKNLSPEESKPDVNNGKEEDRHEGTVSNIAI